MRQALSSIPRIAPWQVESDSDSGKVKGGNMLLRAAFGTAIVAGVMAGAAFGQETQETRSAHYQSDKRDSSVLRLSDEQRPVASVAQRVQRLFQAIGLPIARQEARPSAETKAKTNSPAGAAKHAGREQTGAPRGGEPTLLAVETQAPRKPARTKSSVPINVLREPAPTGFASHETSSSEPQPAENTLRSTTPSTEGTPVLKSSRRTAQLAAKGTSATPSPGATGASVSETPLPTVDASTPAGALPDQPLPSTPDDQALGEGPDRSPQASQPSGSVPASIAWRKTTSGTPQLPENALGSTPPSTEDMAGVQSSSHTAQPMANGTVPAGSPGVAGSPVKGMPLVKVDAPMPVEALPSPLSPSAPDDQRTSEGLDSRPPEVPSPLSDVKLTEPTASPQPLTAGQVPLMPLPPLRSSSNGSEDSLPGEQPLQRDLAAAEAEATAPSSASPADSNWPGSSVAGPAGEAPQAEQPASPANELPASSETLAPAYTPVARQLTGVESDSRDLPPELPADVEPAPLPVPPLARKSDLPPLPDPPNLAVTGQRKPSAARVDVSQWALLPPSWKTRQVESVTASDARPQDRVGPARRTASPQPAPLRVAVQECRRLRTLEDVALVVSEQNEICEVVRYGDREIALIGKQHGTARFEVWYNREGTKRASYTVAVERSPQDEAALEEGRQRVERLLKYLYPDSRVTLVRGRDCLIARGSAVNQEQAAKILATVRRSQLLPVVDEIALRSAAK